MTREEAIERLRKAQQNDDPESAHVDADYVLCTLLMSLGYGSVVEAYLDIDKWVCLTPRAEPRWMSWAPLALAVLLAALVGYVWWG